MPEHYKGSLKMEKNYPTEKEMGAKQSYKAIYYLVGGLIAIIMLLVVIIAVAGGMFVFKYNGGNQKQIVPKYDETKDVKKNGEVDNVKIDRERRIEKFTHRNPDGEISSIVVIDFYSRLVSMYVKDVDTCFLLGGLLKDLGTFENSLQIINNQSQTLQMSGSPARFVREEQQLMNYNLLTDDLVPYCNRGNGLYWLIRRGFVSDHIACKSELIKLEILKEKHFW